jgi:hypothetical protein
VQVFRYVLAGLVTLLWLVGYVLAYTKGSDAQAPTELTGLMVIVLGWAFGGTVKDALKRKNDDDKRDDSDA